MGAAICGLGGVFEIGGRRQIADRGGVLVGQHDRARARVHQHSDALAFDLDIGGILAEPIGGDGRLAGRREQSRWRDRREGPHRSGIVGLLAIGRGLGLHLGENMNERLRCDERYERPVNGGAEYGAGHRHVP